MRGSGEHPVDQRKPALTCGDVRHYISVVRVVSVAAETHFSPSRPTLAPVRRASRVVPRPGRPPALHGRCRGNRSRAGGRARGGRASQDGRQPSRCLPTARAGPDARTAPGREVGPPGLMPSCSLIWTPGHLALMRAFPQFRGGIGGPARNATLRHGAVWTPVIWSRSVAQSKAAARSDRFCTSPELPGAVRTKPKCS